MIRLAQAKDIPFVRELARECIVHSIPETRSVDPEVVREYLLEQYENLEGVLQRYPTYVILVEEDTARQELTGYIMLEFEHIEPATGEKQCFIHDLAVRPDRRGRFTVHRLIKKAADLTSARGLKYLVGQVTINNARTFNLAQKAFDFQVERYQIVKQCKPRERKRKPAPE